MLETMSLAILVGAGLVVAASFTTWIAFRFGAPLLLIFLAVGLFAGEDGLGLDFDNAPVAYFLGSLALAIVLFDSGFGTPLSAFRQAALPAIVLATLGVAITTVLVGVAAHWLMGLDWAPAMLLGAAVSSTDAAAVFFLLRVGGIHLRDRVRSVLEVESGCNDPTAIFLTMTIVAAMSLPVGQSLSALSLIWSFVREIGLGLVLGLAGGLLIVRVVNRIDLDSALYPIVVLASALVLFGVAGVLHCSGYLAVYAAGLYAGNRRLRRAATLRRFQDGTTWLAQIAMFVVFGLFATPSEFPSVLAPALGIAVFLIFVARPVAVWLSFQLLRVQPEETAFVAWVGLRGAVSLLLALLPLIFGLPGGQAIFNAAFIVVVVSLVVQGWTIAPMARRLGLIIPPTLGPVEKVELELPGTAHHELVVYHVVADSPVARGARLPRWARPSLVVRKGQSMRFQFAGRVEADDHVYLFTSPRNIRLLDRLFASPAQLSADDEDFFGAFAIDPRQPLTQVAEIYGVAAPELGPVSIGAFMQRRLGGRAEVGDRVVIDFVELVVRDTDESGTVTAVGLTLAPQPAQGPGRWPALAAIANAAGLIDRAFPWISRALPRARRANAARQP